MKWGSNFDIPDVNDNFEIPNTDTNTGFNSPGERAPIDGVREQI
jgi:hypothetical protein